MQASKACHDRLSCALLLGMMKPYEMQGDRCLVAVHVHYMCGTDLPMEAYLARFDGVSLV